MTGEVDPLALPLTTYMFVLGVAVVGGLVGYLNRPAKGGVFWGQALLVALTSGFLGFLTFCVCIAKGWDMPWTLVTVGVVGMMGKRAIVDLENIVRLRLGALAEPETPPTLEEEQQ